MDELQLQPIFSNVFAFAALLSGLFELLKNELPPAKNVWVTRLYVFILAALLGGLGLLTGYLEYPNAISLVLGGWLIATGIYAAFKSVAVSKRT